MARKRNSTKDNHRRTATNFDKPDFSEPIPIIVKSEIDIEDFDYDYEMSLLDTMSFLSKDVDHSGVVPNQEDISEEQPMKNKSENDGIVEPDIEVKESRPIIGRISLPKFVTDLIRNNDTANPTTDAIHDDHLSSGSLLKSPSTSFENMIGRSEISDGGESTSIIGSSSGGSTIDVNNYENGYNSDSTASCEMPILQPYWEPQVLLTECSRCAMNDYHVQKNVLHSIIPDPKEMPTTIMNCSTTKLLPMSPSSIRESDGVHQNLDYRSPTTILPRHSKERYISQTPNCNRIFMHRKTLRSHQLYHRHLPHHHGRKNAKTLRRAETKCYFCRKNFSPLICHLRKHTGEKNVTMEEELPAQIVQQRVSVRMRKKKTFEMFEI